MPQRTLKSEESAATTSGFELVHRINDNTAGFPTRRTVVHATPEELDTFVREGFLLRRGLFGHDDVARYRAAVDEVAVAESEALTAEKTAETGLYLRSLLDKHESFHDLIRFQPTLSVARALLGPQVWFDIDARVAHAGVAGARVPWHIHMRVVPEPKPQFFCYPHQIHVLVYLDHVGVDEGRLCVLPGSHLKDDLVVPPQDTANRRGQIELSFEAGDVLLVHGNLWHRTEPSTERGGRRRLLLMGYQPSWIKSDVARGVKPAHRLTDRLRAAGDPELVELLDGFHW